jgi:hypothetical protein
MKNPYKEQKILERADQYRAYLHIHGALTERENEKVKNRIKTKYLKCIEEKEKMRPSNIMCGRKG